MECGVTSLAKLFHPDVMDSRVWMPSGKTTKTVLQKKYCFKYSCTSYMPRIYGFVVCNCAYGIGFHGFFASSLVNYLNGFISAVLHARLVKVCQRLLYTYERINASVEL